MPCYQNVLLVRLRVIFIQKAFRCDSTPIGGFRSFHDLRCIAYPIVGSDSDGRALLVNCSRAQVHHIMIIRIHNAGPKRETRESADLDVFFAINFGVVTETTLGSNADDSIFRDTDRVVVIEDARPVENQFRILGKKQHGTPFGP